MEVRSNRDVRSAMTKVRLSALNIIDKRIQNAYFLVDIKSAVGISAFVLTYQLYAEEFEASEELTERATDIRELNPTQPSDYMVGDLKVLQK